MIKNKIDVREIPQYKLKNHIKEFIQLLEEVDAEVLDLTHSEVINTLDIVEDLFTEFQSKILGRP